MTDMKVLEAGLIRLDKVSKLVFNTNVNGWKDHYMCKTGMHLRKHYRVHFKLDKNK